MGAEKMVLLEKSNGIATITLNRPAVLNTLHPDLIVELISALTESKDDPEVRVVVITGAGKAFCAGGDLPYIETIDNALAAHEYISKAGVIITSLENMEKPVIAMVNGVAAGAGFNLALACDVIFCAKSTRFAQSFAKVGLIPDCGGTYFLPRAIGIHKAKELMFTADLIDANAALQLGLVNHVVEDAELKAETYKLAARLVKAAPAAIALIKKLLNQSYSLELKQSLDFETGAQCICIQTQDNKEGVRAFKEKREPVFKGV